MEVAYATAQNRSVDSPLRAVTERLRGLPSPLRYLVYVAGALLAFLVAVGAGATAALVVGWQQGQVGSGSGGPTVARTLEESVLETTSNASAFEDTAIETPNIAKNATTEEPADEVSFVHRATDENSRGDYTYLSYPSINGDPNAIVLVAPTPDRGSIGGASYDHNIGVWYAPVAHKWAIFNQDRAAVPAGATFEVAIPRGPEKFIHRATLDNTVANGTYLDESLTNGNPDAVLSVTQNWNPGGGSSGVYNDHPIGIRYDAERRKWVIYNRDGAPMPKGAAFNVALSGDAEPAR